jgi:hypothetical protein
VRSRFIADLISYRDNGSLAAGIIDKKFVQAVGKSCSNVGGIEQSPQFTYLMNVMRLFAAFCGVQTPFLANYGGTPACRWKKLMLTIYPFFDVFKHVSPINWTFFSSRN